MCYTENNIYFLFDIPMSLLPETRINGMHDVFPEGHKYLTFLKKVFRHEFRKNGFRRISTPLLEETSLLRKVYPEGNNDYGLYHFYNKEDVDVTLLPSASVGIMRAYLENDIFTGLQPTYYYYMERYFRQNMALKEAYLIGGEVIGESDPIIDAQNIYMIYTGLKKIGLAGDITIRINSYGNSKEMEKYKQELAAFFENKKASMSPEIQGAFEKNMFSIFASRHEDDQILARSAPSIIGFLKKDSKKYYDDMKMYLDDLGVPYTQDHTLFFGEGYYSHMIWKFEDASGKTIAK